jgi:hypothetical protein
VNTITPDTQNLTPFNPSDALPPPRVKGTLLPFSVKQFGEDKDVQFDTPEFVDSMIESFKLPGKALTGQLGIASINNPLYTKGANQFVMDYGLNPALLNAVRAPSAVKTGQLNIIASHNAKDGPKILKKHVKMIAKEGMDGTFQKNKSFQDPIDGRLSFEISTNKMYVPEQFFKRKTFEDQAMKADRYGPTDEMDGILLTDILKGMPELFKQYPKLKQVRVAMDDTGDEAPFFGGSASPLMSQIYIGGGTVKSANTKEGKEYFEEVLMHEVQHLVDNIERRSAGSSPSGIMAQIADGSEGYLKTALKQALAMDIYKRNAGEVRARMVEQRLKKGMEDEFPDPDTNPEEIIRNEDVLLELVNQSKSVPKLRDVMKGQDESFMRQTNRSLLKAVKGERDDGI